MALPLAEPTPTQFNEDWRCGNCGKSFSDATSCCAHESQCGGHFSHC
jgi:hypothetical protein